jgi:non-heme chloroperoxidase
VAEPVATHSYDAVAPGWPGEATTVDEARANPEVIAGIGIEEITDHYTGIVKAHPAAPVLIGHSFGGLISQKLLGQGCGRAAVALDAVQAAARRRLRSGFAVLGNPANKKRAVWWTAKQFRYGSGNALTEGVSNELFEAFTIPSPGRPLFEAALANFTKNSPAAVDGRNATRAPLLLMPGHEDRTVPRHREHVRRSRSYVDSTATTELKQFADRCHSLVLDKGWRTVADYALGFLARQGVAPDPVR